MKYFFVAGLALNFLALDLFAQTKIDLKLDWPEVSLNQRTVKELVEKKSDFYVVDFWASWCEPCLESLPFYVEELKKLKLDNWSLVTINMDTEKNAGEEFLKKMKLDAWVLHDAHQKLAHKLGVVSLPTLFFIDSKGDVVKKEMGFNKKSKALFRKNLEELRKKK